MLGIGKQRGMLVMLTMILCAAEASLMDQHATGRTVSLIVVGAAVVGALTADATRHCRR